MRATLALLFLSMLSVLAFPFSLSTDKTEYLKGETIKITGTAQPGELVSLSISSGPRGMYKDSVIASNGSFQASYPLAFSDPKGNWDVKASAGSGSSNARITVSPTREGAYYLVRFTSPAYENFEFSRSESVIVSVSVFDSGNPVSGASVKAWAGDHPFALAETASGVYQGDYEIPPDSKTGSMDIYVVVEKKSGGSQFGGENSLKIQVKEVPIQIEFISPTAGSYKMGETIPVKFRLSYSTGKSVVDPMVTVMANDAQLQLSVDGDVFSGNYNVSDQDANILKSGTVRISVDATDSGGNKGSAYKVIEVKGLTTQAVTEYYWYLIIGGFILIAIIAIAIRWFMARSALERLEKERGELVALEKGLQEEYIKKGSIDRQNYERRMADYESRLSELDRKIRKEKDKK